MRRRERRLRALLLALIMTGVCSALGASLLTTPAQALEGSDWQHALRVVRDLRASPPDPPVVLLLGGSCARETTVSNKDWAADVQRRSGVNRGRFTSPPKTTTSTTPVTAKGDYSQHHYSSARIQTLERKQKLVLYWMRQRYPVFTERYAANLAQLDKLIALCKQRGYHPVVLDLPRNMEVIGDAFDAPIRQYQDGCRDLAAQHAVPFIDEVDEGDGVLGGEIAAAVLILPDRCVEGVADDLHVARQVEHHGMVAALLAQGNELVELRQIGGVSLREDRVALTHPVED